MVNYDDLPDEELAELAYRLQIDYDPYNFDRFLIIDELNELKHRIMMLPNKKNWWMLEDDIRQARRDSRRDTPCYESRTFLANKDIDLMSNAQLAFLPSIDGYYCLDKHDDVAEILAMGYNPFTNRGLNYSQEEYLQDILENDPYPKIEVGDYFEELERHFGSEDFSLGAITKRALRR